MSLPADFWAMPDAFGVTGIFVGMAAGMLLGELVRAVWLGYLW